MINRAEDHILTMYALLTESRFRTEGNTFIIDNPDETLRFKTRGELIRFAADNLEYIRKAYIDNGELAAFKAIEQHAMKGDEAQ